MFKSKFLICDDDKNIVEVLTDENEVISCDGKPMHELVANSTDAAKEKHVPQVSVNGNSVKVDVGSVSHPMEEAHSIKWVHIVTNKGIQRKYLEANTAPVVEFALCNDEKLEEVYAYCNLHGLWMIKAKLQKNIQGCFDFHPALDILFFI